MMPGRSLSINPRRRTAHKPPPRLTADTPYISPTKASLLPPASKTPSRTSSLGLKRPFSDLKVLKQSEPQSVEPPRFMINLEDLVVLEDRLCSIAEGLKLYRSSAHDFEEWWLLISGNALCRVPSLFRDERVRGLMREAMLLEVVSVALAEFCFLIGSPPSMMLSQVQTLMFHVHQSFLVVLSFLLSRLQDSSSNAWAKNLTETIERKKVKRAKRCENSDFLRQNNGVVENIIKSVCRMNVLRNTNERARAYRIIVLAGMQVMRRRDALDLADARKAMQQALDAVAFQGKDPAKLVHSGEELPESLSLPPVSYPFLPPLACEKLTLVLDLDETLVHYFETETCGRYLVRPGVKEFLAQLSPYYELVVFTAAMQEYADWVLDEVDVDRCISHRLYREHTMQAGSTFMKDLSQLGRSLAKTIIIDNVPENFQLQPTNGILIRSWYDDVTDSALLELLPLLKGEVSI